MFFTLVTAGDLCTHSNARTARCLNATAYFQAMMADVLNGMIGRWCLAWVNDVAFWARDAETFLVCISAALERLLERGVFATTSEAVFFQREIMWCARIYSGKATLQDPACVQGLLDLRRPETS